MTGRCIFSKGVYVLCFYSAQNISSCSYFFFFFFFFSNVSMCGSRGMAESNYLTQEEETGGNFERLVNAEKNRRSFKCKYYNSNVLLLSFSSKKGSFKLMFYAQSICTSLYFGQFYPHLASHVGELWAVMILMIIIISW